MSAFIETSFLCSVYRTDLYTGDTANFLAKTEGTLETSTLVLFEFRQSLRLQSFQRKNGSPVSTTPELAAAMIGGLHADLKTGRYEISNPDWPTVHAQAETLSSKHTETSGHRFADILHVATALSIGAREFLTFDSGQRTLAEAEGLTVPL